MRQQMPGDTQEIDKGPAVVKAWPRVPPDPPWLREVVKQGRYRPRILSYEGRRLAQANREDARDQAAAMEAWAQSELGMRPYGGRIPLHSEYIPSEGEVKG